ncbi:hypothetical protein Tco_1335728 [Tanacetum coccineum]
MSLDSGIILGDSKCCNHSRVTQPGRIPGINNVSIAKIDGEDNMLMQEVSISRIGSLVVWATIPREISYMTNHGLETTLDSGFVISPKAHPRY